MKDVISHLNLGSKDEIRMVGIHGIGGVGKTTLALTVYNSITDQFQGCCYLENDVRENFEKHGLMYLQKIILSETVGEKKIELTSSKQGITIITKRLGQKKVLLVLDDVDKLEQLEAIAGSRDWFGRGSRVIITTRDTWLLMCHEVEQCSSLTQIPDISGLLNLEEYRVEGCGSLISIDDSVGLLDKLQVLSLTSCEKLKSIPPLKFLSLEELHLSECESLKSFPPLELPSLETLELDQCPSLENFSSLDGLLGSLTILRISQCKKIRSIPPLELPSLEELWLSHCDGLEIFSPIVHELLSKLKVLIVQSCKNLKSIQPLKLPSLEKLELSYCNSLESFPIVMAGSLGKLKSLTVVSCRNLKSFLQLKLASPETLELRDCGSLESFLPLVDGWMGKLQVLRIMCCRNHRSIPPITFISPEELELSCDCCRDDIPKIEELHWDDTPLKELPFSFQDLTCLQTLYLKNCGIVQLPGSIVAMSKRDQGEENVIPIQSSRVEFCLWNYKLSDETLAIGLKWFANVKKLDLSLSGK